MGSVLMVRATRAAALVLAWTGSAAGQIPAIGPGAPRLHRSVLQEAAIDGGAECLLARRSTHGLDPARLSAASAVASRRSAEPTIAARRGVASSASAGFDATYYALDLRLPRVDAAAIEGTTRVAGRVVAATLAVLELDLHPDLRVSAASTPEGTPLAFSQAGAVLSVALQTPAPAGTTVAIDVTYSGTPPGSGFGSFVVGRLTNGDPYVWTLSEPYGAREWWPSKDHPADKADSVDVAFTVPDPLRVGSNGLLVDGRSNGDGTTTWAWRHRYPISTYLVSVAGGVYEVSEQTYRRPDSLAALLGALELPILHYAFAGSGAFEGSPDGTVATLGWKRVVDMLPVFEHWFGPYPFPREKYGHAHFTFGGAMEHQTMTSMTGAYAGTVAHELAHQWFGDAVGPRTWPDLWLNEGFATFAELLWWEAFPRVYPDAPVTVTAGQVFDLYYDRALRATGTLVLEDTTSVGSMFAHSRVYSKGAMVLHMLRSILGDTVMRDLLATWATDPSRAYGAAATADFERHVEEATGQDFSTFFRQWVTDGTGYPVYEASWSVGQAGDAWKANVVLSQVQDPSLSNVPAFEMPVEFAFQTAHGERRVTVLQEERTRTVEVTLDARPTALAVDPDRKILRAPDVVVTRTERAEGPPVAGRVVATYPSPARDVLSVLIDRAGGSATRLDLYDLLGRRAASRDVAPGPAGRIHETLRVAGLAPGVYFLRLAGASGGPARPVVVTGR